VEELRKQNYHNIAPLFLIGGSRKI
jgi:hypothetical protein